MYYFGKRFYDPEIARWISVDPIHEFYDSYRYTTNPIAFIDVQGEYELSARITTKYSTAARIINNLGNKLNFKKLSAFKIYGQATAKQVKDAMTFGNGPLVRAAIYNNPPGKVIRGSYDPNTESIKIAESILVDVENRVPGAAEFLELLMEHETVHYFDDQDNEDFPGEEGEAYESSVYGRQISYDEAFKYLVKHLIPDRFTPRKFKNNVSINWNAVKEEAKGSGVAADLKEKEDMKESNR